MIYLVLIILIVLLLVLYIRKTDRCAELSRDLDIEQSAPEDAVYWQKLSATLGTELELYRSRFGPINHAEAAAEQRFRNEQFLKIKQLEADKTWAFNNLRDVTQQLRELEEKYQAALARPVTTTPSVGRDRRARRKEP